MTFQYIRMSDLSGVVIDDENRIRQITRCAVGVDEEHVKDVYDYIERFGLQAATFDAVLSMIFEMGLREMKSQTDLDKYLDEQDEQNMDKVSA